MTVLPAMLILFGIAAAVIRRAGPYDAFLRGAGEGMRMMIHTAPGLFAAVLCASMLQKSGLTESLIRQAAPLMRFFGLPEEVLPLLILRPISGSAALAQTEQIIVRCGADSFAARTACAVMGSTETVLYTLGVYTAGVRIPRLQQLRILAVCLLTSIAGAYFAAWICG